MVKNKLQVTPVQQKILIGLQYLGIAPYAFANLRSLLCLHRKGLVRIHLEESNPNSYEGKIRYWELSSAGKSFLSEAKLDKNNEHCESTLFEI